MLLICISFAMANNVEDISMLFTYILIREVFIHVQCQFLIEVFILLLIFESPVYVLHLSLLLNTGNAYFL